MDNITKARHLQILNEYRQKLRKQPVLKFLFLEFTLRCNERCLHCGSSCGDVTSTEFPTRTYFEFLEKIKHDFDELPMLCITGGEPLLRRDFFEITDYANKLGFNWGMTSNGTLITKDIARKLKETGMKTISVSIDGLEETHDNFRRTKGGFKRAADGVKNLLEQDFDSVQVTTVVTKKNIEQLDSLFELMCELDVDSWRVINIEPIGRALGLHGYTLDAEDYARMFDFIKEKRNSGFPVLYGCSHFLGLDYEREVRDWYFLCNAGIYTASVMSNGDIGACLDIERRPETIQGNILSDDFTDVWYNRFDIFRRSLSERNEKCRSCDSCSFCEGGSYHSWNYDENRQMVCFREILANNNCGC